MHWQCSSHIVSLQHPAHAQVPATKSSRDQNSCLLALALSTAGCAGADKDKRRCNKCAKEQHQQHSSRVTLLSDLMLHRHHPLREPTRGSLSTAAPYQKLCVTHCIELCVWAVRVEQPLDILGGRKSGLFEGLASIYGGLGVVTSANSAVPGLGIHSDGSEGGAAAALEQCLGSVWCSSC